LRTAVRQLLCLRDFYEAITPLDAPHQAFPIRSNAISAPTCQRTGGPAADCTPTGGRRFIRSATAPWSPPGRPAKCGPGVGRARGRSPFFRVRSGFGV
jgi:hypothetical protein